MILDIAASELTVFKRRLKARLRRHSEVMKRRAAKLCKRAPESQHGQKSAKPRSSNYRSEQEYQII